MRKAFILYTSYGEHLKLLSDEQCGVLFRAIYAYESDEPLPEMDPMTTMAFSFIKSQLQIDNDKYDDTCEKRREAGKKGGRPKQMDIDEKQKKQMLFEKPDKEEEEEKDKEEYLKEKQTKRKAERFSAPTIEEVKEYCQERNNTVDPERFIDFYESVGWKVGNKPMKDWRAAVRTWEKREDQPRARSGTTNKFKNFEERTTDLDRLEAEFYRMQDEKLKRELYG